MTWSLGHNTLIDTRYGGASGSFNSVSHAPNTCDGPVPRRDALTGRQTGNIYYCYRGESLGHRASATVSHYASAFAGAHDFRAGVEFERTHEREAYNTPGGIAYIDMGGVP